MERPLTQQQAVALRYDPKEGDTAPRIVAKGSGFIAEQILRIAKENNIPLRQDAELTSALASLDLGSTVPPELFQAVAQILAFIYKMNGRT
jgi:flagellar biosynthesis protein